MKQMIGSYRYFYNQGIVYLNSLERGYYIPKKATKTKPPEYIKYEDQYIRVESGGEYCYGIIPQYNSDGKQISQTGFQAIRNHLQDHRPNWYIGLPAHLIDQAARECAGNFQSIIQRRKLDKKKFHMKFKSKKNSPMETITMEKSSLSSKGKIYPNLFREYDSYIYCNEPMDFKTNKHEYKITYDRNTHGYYLSLIVKKLFSTGRKSNLDKWCSIDPGEKIFATIYNPFDMEVMFVGVNERKSFNDSTVDKLRSSISKRKTKGKVRALQLALNRDKNRRTELHHKLANYLCSNFKHIVIPEYGIKNMNLHTTVNRSMRNLGFYQFLMFLKHKCSERNVKLYVVNESYTSRACCSCGTLNTPNDREYSCAKCKTEIHRDVNGAVNIGLKHLK
jgi:IS605 OrfB family transposase